MMWFMIFGDFGSYTELGPMRNERQFLFIIVSFFMPLIITNLFVALVSGESYNVVNDVRHLTVWMD